MSLETIKERADAATPGPWHRLPAQEGTGFDDRMGAVLTNGDLTPVAYTAALGFQQRHSDAAFIAHARQDIPALLRVAEAAALYRTAMAVALEYGDSNDPHGDRLWDAATSTGDALTRALDELDALP